MSYGRDTAKKTEGKGAPLPKPTADDISNGWPDRDKDGRKE